MGENFEEMAPFILPKFSKMSPKSPKQEVFQKQVSEVLKVLQVF